MTECQGCGAWNDTSRTLCVLCGTPLAEIDEWDAAAELPPLPPLPDGGLRQSMPSWLREPPITGVQPAPVASLDPDIASEQVHDLPPLGSHADPRTFLSDDDFPQWLHELAVLQETTRRSGEPTVEPALPGAAARPTEPARPIWPGSNAFTASASVDPAARIAPPTLPEAVLAPDSAPIPASELERVAAPVEPAPVAAPSSEDRRGRDVWETLLLVLLVVGVIAAALWALVANGVVSPSL